MPRFRLLPTLASLAALFCLLSVPAAGAGEIDLTGQWTFAFSIEDGPSYADPCVIEQEGNAFKGMVVYEEGGKQYKEPFEGAVTPDGSVNFTLYDAGQAVQHLGQVSDDGNTVTGQWSFPDANGTFTLTRQ